MAVTSHSLLTPPPTPPATFTATPTSTLSLRRQQASLRLQPASMRTPVKGVSTALYAKMVEDIKTMHSTFRTLFRLLQAHGHWDAVRAAMPPLPVDISEDTIGVRDCPDKYAAETAHALSMGAYTCVAEVVAKTAGAWDVPDDTRRVLWQAAHDVLRAVARFGAYYRGPLPPVSSDAPALSAEDAQLLDLEMYALPDASAGPNNANGDQN